MTRVVVRTAFAVAARTAFAAALLALGSCVLGPDYSAPPPPDHAAGALVSHDAKTMTDDAAPDAWWRLYDDPLLDNLVQTAFVANNDLKAAEANLDAAAEIVRAARTALYPSTKLEAGATYGRDPNTNEILDILGHRAPVQWIDSVSGTLSYEVDLFGRLHRSIEASTDDAEAQESMRNSVRVAVAAQTARAYADICDLGDQLAVARRSLDLAANQSGIVAREEAAGAASRFDVTRVAVIEAQARSAIPPLEGRRQAALFELAALTGKSPADAPAELLACTTPPKLKNLLPVGDGAALLARRPDIRTADRRLAAATARIGVATAELYPNISLGASYGSIASRPDDLTRFDSINWGVGPLISWSFPNISLARARIAQAEAGQRAALASFDGVVLQALKETEQALVAYSAELDRHQALAAAEDQAHQAYDLSHNRFAAGSVSRLDLLTAEQVLISTAAQRAASDGAIIDDQIAVFRALGGGWRDR